MGAQLQILRCKHSRMKEELGIETAGKETLPWHTLRLVCTKQESPKEDGDLWRKVRQSDEVTDSGIETARDRCKSSVRREVNQTCQGQQKTTVPGLAMTVHGKASVVDDRLLYCPRQQLCHLFNKKIVSQETMHRRAFSEGAMAKVKEVNWITWMKILKRRKMHKFRLKPTSCWRSFSSSLILNKTRRAVERLWVSCFKRFGLAFALKPERIRSDLGGWQWLTVYSNVLGVKMIK